jgi:hypothetical protein
MSYPKLVQDRFILPLRKHMVSPHLSCKLLHLNLPCQHSYRLYRLMRYQGSDRVLQFGCVHKCHIRHQLNWQ